MSSAIGACGLSSTETGVAEESTRLAESQQKRSQPPSALNRNHRVLSSTSDILRSPPLTPSLYTLNHAVVSVEVVPGRVS